MTRTVIPQTTELWLTEADTNSELPHGFSLARVIGWNLTVNPPSEDYENDRVMLPLVTFQDADGQVYWTGYPDQDGKYFLASTPAEAVTVFQRAVLAGPHPDLCGVAHPYGLGRCVRDDGHPYASEPHTNGLHTW